MSVFPPEFKLAKGAHLSREQGACLLEAVAWHEGLPHSDRPECVSEVLGGFGRSLNDVLGDEKRQLLRPFVTLLPGTAGDGRDEARGYLALDWLVRVYAPSFLRLVPDLVADADLLAGSPQIQTLADATAVGSLVRAAAKKSAAAGDAAGDAWAAAWAAAGAAAGDAAWAAAGAAAGDAAGDAWAAARAAAGAAARAKLAPTVDALQDSAIELYLRMVTA
jgi:hypothetical protein